MYQIVPLLLALALILPWSGPADPSDRIAAANAADGLAVQALVYHQAAVAYVRTHPNATGSVPVTLPPGWSASGISSCVHATLLATAVTVPSTVSKPALAAAMARLWGGYPLAGQTQAGSVTNTLTGAALTLPCPMPDQTPVLVSQVGG